jgi:galactokinase
MEVGEPLDETIDRASELLRQTFGVPPKWIAAAPGRVNLIGEHTDYNDGFVCPMAIERYTVIAAAPATDVGEMNAVDVASDVVGDRRRIQIGGDGAREKLPPWCEFVRGVLELLAPRGMKTGPIVAAITSSVPLGGGLSSSAALEVATATLVEAITGKQLDPREKARVCQECEHKYVGMPCGIMDQFSSVLCRAGEAMRLDCRSLETTPVNMADPSTAVLVINSNVKHELTGSEYPTRRAQCGEAAKALGVASLRDATAGMLEAGRGKMEDIIWRRARHVVGENARVLEFSEAAAQRNWVKAGELMYASHESLRDDYEVSCPEIDALVAAARGVGVAGGVYGSRITGGGFGGCTVTLCRAEAAGRIADEVLADYQRETGKRGTAFVTRPARGAHVVKP